MSTWGDVASYRNQRDVGDYRNDSQSVWDEHNIDDYDDWQAEKKSREEEARDSWGNDGGDQDRWGDDQDQDKQPERKRGPGSRGGRPDEFDHAQQRTEFLGHDTRGAKRKINQARHPMDSSKKKIKKEAKKSSFWQKHGSSSHTFHNPNAQR
jgi:hypothetical protein